MNLKCIELIFIESFYDDAMINNINQLIWIECIWVELIQKSLELNEIIKVN